MESIPIYSAEIVNVFTLVHFLLDAKSNFCQTLSIIFA